jgi:hypothetical protein
MTPRERVLAALRREQPDQVPWIENDIEEEIQVALMNGRTDFTPGELCARSAWTASATTSERPEGLRQPVDSRPPARPGKEAWYAPTHDMTSPPWIADMGTDAKSAAFTSSTGSSPAAIA